MFFLRRQQARFQSERVASTEPHAEDRRAEAGATGTVEESDVEEEGAFMNALNASSPPSDAPPLERVVERSPASRREEEESESEDEEEIVGVHRHSIRHTSVNLSELEEERELARRRSSVCLLFALFVLFRLWILALQDGDFGLLLLCLVGSSWTARWVRYNRDQEEELDRRIANYLQNSSDAENGTSGRDDLRLLSFQAQLALAIMESQRQMMQGGGYGHSDGQTTPGVSEEAQAKWKTFAYKASRDKKESRRGSYGSVAQGEVVKPAEEEPHCSICLGEYEEGEELSKLPCAHIYHHECIASWCSNHTRCPLCNADLEASGLEAV
jgi:Ring finger domain